MSEKRQQNYKTFKTVNKKNYYITLLLLISVLAASCGNNKYVSKEYISTNLSNEKIELSKELFSKLKKDHYIKKFVGEISINDERKIVFMGNCFVKTI